MKRHIDCIGFKASESTVSWMSELLSELQHGCPYNSYVDASVVKYSNNYHVKISIRHSYGKFSAITKDENLEHALQENAHTITLQLQKWYKSRFKQDYEFN